MISDESGNRFFPTAVTDYWQDKAACRHEDQRKRQISGLSSMSMVVIVRYLSSGLQLLYAMPWGLQTLKNMMNYTRCDHRTVFCGVTDPTQMTSSVTQTQYYVFYAVVACNKILTVLFGVERVR